MVEENELKPLIKGQGIGIPPAPAPLSKKESTKAPSAPAAEIKAPEAPHEAHAEKQTPIHMMDAANPDMLFHGSNSVHRPEQNSGYSPGITHAPDISASPPLFIKLDKYGDIVKNLQKLKSFSLTMRDALDAVSDIEKELTSGISLAHKALDEFNHAIANLDSKVLRAHGSDTSTDTKEIDDYIKNVYGQMERIKKELGSIKDV